METLAYYILHFDLVAELRFSYQVDVALNIIVIMAALVLILAEVRRLSADVYAEDLESGGAKYHVRHRATYTAKGHPQSRKRCGKTLPREGTSLRALMLMGMLICMGAATEIPGKTGL